jgi:hypothetical protein
MTDNTELQRLTRIRRLGRQIAASLPPDLDLEQTFQISGHARELPARAPRNMSKPTSSKAMLRAELEVALVNYRGRVTLCPPAPPPELREELDVDNDEGECEAADAPPPAG